MKHVIVPLADGFEEIEAVAIIDILRRAGVAVTVAGVGGRQVTGSHDIRVECDRRVEQCRAAQADAVVLPGGLPGTTNLGASEAVRSLVSSVHAAGGLVAAICAAPTLLNAAGMLDGKSATGHPAHADEMDRCRYSTERVVTDGNVVTSRGAGTAVEFAAELVRLLVGAETADDIMRRIVHE
jgi:4-methyl-5(b-hydroxyethyl)-thiazole monophosphate biosynthesis